MIQLVDVSEQEKATVAEEPALRRLPVLLSHDEASALGHIARMKKMKRKDLLRRIALEYIQEELRKSLKTIEKTLTPDPFILWGSTFQTTTTVPGQLWFTSPNSTYTVTGLSTSTATAGSYIPGNLSVSLTGKITSP